jgi:hypothetical protein
VKFDVDTMLLLPREPTDTREGRLTGHASWHRQDIMIHSDEITFDGGGMSDVCLEMSLLARCCLMRDTFDISPYSSSSSSSSLFHVFYVFFLILLRISIVFS